MPFVVNGKIVNKSDKDDSFAKDIVEAQEQIIKGYGLDEGSIRFVYADGLEVPSKINPGRIDRPRSFTVPFRETLRNDKGTFEFIYYEQANPQGPNKVTYFPDEKDFQGSWTLGLEDIDLIYFLLYVSKWVTGSKNQSKVKRAYLKVFDPIGDAKRKVSTAASKSFIEAKVLNDEKRGGLSETKLRQLAGSMLVKGHNRENAYILRMQINKTLLGRSDGYDVLYDFITNKSAHSNDVSDLVKKAFDTKVIGVVQEGAIKKCYFLDKQEKQHSLICNIPPKRNADFQEYILSWMMDDKNKETLDLLKGNIE